MTQIEYTNSFLNDSTARTEADLQKMLNKREDFSKYEWEPDEEKVKMIGNIIADVVDYCWPGFYGFKGTIEGTDVALALDVSDIGNDVGTLSSHLSSYLKHIKKISITPKEGYATLELLIEDVFWK